MLRLRQNALSIHGNASRRRIILPDVVSTCVGEELGNIAAPASHIPLSIEGQVGKHRGTVLHISTKRGKSIVSSFDVVEPSVSFVLTASKYTNDTNPFSTTQRRVLHIVRKGEQHRSRDIQAALVAIEIRRIQQGIRLQLYHPFNIGGGFRTDVVDLLLRQKRAHSAIGHKTAFKDAFHTVDFTQTQEDRPLRSRERNHRPHRHL